MWGRVAIAGTVMYQRSPPRKPYPARVSSDARGMANSHFQTWRFPRLATWRGGTGSMTPSTAMSGGSAGPFRTNRAETRQRSPCTPRKCRIGPTSSRRLFGFGGSGIQEVRYCGMPKRGSLVGTLFLFRLLAAQQIKHAFRNRFVQDAVIDAVKFLYMLTILMEQGGGVQVGLDHQF